MPLVRAVSVLLRWPGMNAAVERAVRQLGTGRSLMRRGDAAVATHYAWKAYRLAEQGWPVWVVLAAYDLLLRGNPWAEFRRPPLDGPVARDRALVIREGGANGVR